MLFNSYDHFFVRDLHFFHFIKSQPEIEIDADPLIKPLCERICRETPMATRWSCDGHPHQIPKRHSVEAYLVILGDDQVVIERFVQILSGMYEEQIAPLVAAKRITKRFGLTIEVIRNVNADNTQMRHGTHELILRLNYKHSHKVLMWALFSKWLNAGIDQLKQSLLDEPLPVSEIVAPAPVQIEPIELDGSLTEFIEKLEAMGTTLYANCGKCGFLSEKGFIPFMQSVGELSQDKIAILPNMDFLKLSRAATALPTLLYLIGEYKRLGSDEALIALVGYYKEAATRINESTNI